MTAGFQRTLESGGSPSARVSRFRPVSFRDGQGPFSSGCAPVLARCQTRQRRLPVGPVIPPKGARSAPTASGPYRSGFAARCYPCLPHSSRGDRPVLDLDRPRGAPSGRHRMAPEEPFGPGNPRDPRRKRREPLLKLPYVRGHSADQRSIARGSPRHAVSGKPGISGWIRDRKVIREGERHVSVRLVIPVASGNGRPFGAIRTLGPLGAISG